MYVDPYDQIYTTGRFSNILLVLCTAFNLRPGQTTHDIPWLLMIKVKSDHRRTFSNLSNWKEEAWKKSGLQQNSNPWPPRYRCDAPPTELWSHTLGARSIYWVHPGAGQKTPEFFVYRSSNEKWRHIRFKLGRAARFTKRKNGVSICQDFLLFATHQARFLSNWGKEDVAGTFLRLWK